MHNNPHRLGFSEAVGVHRSAQNRRHVLAKFVYNMMFYGVSLDTPELLEDCPY